MGINRIFPAAASVSRSICSGRHGRGVWRSVAGHFRLHHFCLRDHPRLQLSAAADAGQRDCDWSGSSAGAQSFDHDGETGRRGLRIHQEYETDVLQQVYVAETMDKDVSGSSCGHDRQ